MAISPIEEELDDLDAVQLQGVLQHLAERPRVVLRPWQLGQHALGELDLIPLHREHQRALHMIAPCPRVHERRGRAITQRVSRHEHSGPDHSGPAGAPSAGLAAGWSRQA